MINSLAVNIDIEINQAATRFGSARWLVVADSESMELMRKHTPGTG